MEGKEHGWQMTPYLLKYPACFFCKSIMGKSAASAFPAGFYCVKKFTWK